MGNLGGLAGADATCQRLANSAGLNGFFGAWLSDSQTDAVDRMNPSDSGYVNMAGETIAADLAGIVDGSLDNAIRFNEFGLSAVDTVYTGTLTDGTRDGDRVNADFCGDWMSTGPTPDFLGGAGISSQSGML